MPSKKLHIVETPVLLYGTPSSAGTARTFVPSNMVVVWSGSERQARYLVAAPTLHRARRTDAQAIINNAVGLLTPAVGTVPNVAAGVGRMMTDEVSRELAPSMTTQSIVTVPAGRFAGSARMPAAIRSVP